jgi:hypothetical protein
MPAGPSALERLLETERRLDTLIAEERLQAEATVKAAREEAARLERLLEEELAVCAQEVEQRLAAERDARLAFVEDEAGRALARFQSISEEQIGRLAEWVVEQVLADSNGAVS